MLKGFSLLLLLSNVHNILSWHGYNYSFSRLEDRSECPSFEEATRPYKHEFIEKLKLWPNLMSQYDVEYGETLYNSKEGLEIIWKNQNPEDCSKAKYLVSGGWPYGFGSRIHMEGAAMGMALHLGRVYLPHPDGDNFFFETHTEFCRNKNRYEPGMNCFYMPSSKCTIKDATAKVGGDVNKLRTYYMGDFRAAFQDETGLDQMVKSLENMQGINLVQITGGGPYDLRNYIPHQMRPLIDCSPMREHADHYWWRAVSATYITRPNRATLALLAAHTTLPVLDFKDTVSMFVRHGDKGIEMKLLDFSEYARVTQLLWDRGMVPQSGNYIRAKLLAQLATAAATNSTAASRRRLRGGRRLQQAQPQPHATVVAGAAVLADGERTTTDRDRRASVSRRLPGTESPASNTSATSTTTSSSTATNMYGAPTNAPPSPLPGQQSLPVVPFNGTIFLTTEDPAVIEEANAWGKANHWTVVYTNLFERATQTAVKTWDEKNRKGTVAVHDKLEYISMLLNLYYSLRSEAYVCTLASNSCRIIDEMRATIGGKANRFYADLSIETCPRPPCMDADDKIVSFAE